MSFCCHLVKATASYVSTKKTSVPQMKKRPLCQEDATKPPFPFAEVSHHNLTSLPSCPRHTSLRHSTRETGQVEKNATVSPGTERPWPSNSQRRCEGHHWHPTMD